MKNWEMVPTPCSAPQAKDKKEILFLEAAAIQSNHLLKHLTKKSIDVYLIGQDILNIHTS